MRKACALASLEFVNVEVRVQDRSGFPGVNVHPSGERNGTRWKPHTKTPRPAAIPKTTASTELQSCSERFMSHAAAIISDRDLGSVLRIDRDGDLSSPSLQAVIYQFCERMGERPVSCFTYREQEVLNIHDFGHTPLQPLFVPAPAQNAAFIHPHFCCEAFFLDHDSK